MSGRKVFTAGEVLQAADVNDFLMDQSVMVFAGTAARGSAIPSPSEGMVTYRSDDDLVEVYNGSSFVPIGTILQVVTAANTTNFSTTSTSFADTALSATITPTSTSNDILVWVNIPYFGKTDTNRSSVLTVFRGTSASGTDLDTGVEGLGNVYSSFSGSWGVGNGACVFDSPSTTSATTYTLALKSSAVSNTATANGMKTMILMEVAG